jgi:nitrogen fixation/metabolism regulation signal transduction histidine kinase
MLKLKQFNVQLVLRMSAMLLTLVLLAFGFAADLRYLLLGALAIIIVLQAISLVRFITHTNHELESFLAGLKFGDFQQTYTISHLGPSFAALEKTLQFTVQKFKDLRTEKEQQAIYYKALVQHIPVPLFVVHADRRVEILNNATRRTFNVADITNTDELANFGAGFQRDVLQVKPGEALLTTIEFAGTQEFFILTATQLTTGGSTHKLISLQNIQSELDATELATWQNLLRVTSHEIINSLAPVSSCAQTAKTLVDDIIDSDIRDKQLREDLRDINASLDTVLRRSEGLTRFIQSYRQLSRMPPPKKKTIQVSAYLQRLESLVRGELARKNIDLNFQLDPKNISVLADKDMLDQVLINLIRNAADVLTDKDNAKITVVAYIDNKQRTVLEVQDNGSGVPLKIVENIFVPFFTTKNQGSGIGLALVRYIMLSHGGVVVYAPGEQSGSVFRLIF